MNTTLVIMAAGIGSRFGGGIKQLEAMGPNGEIIMDYSISDAKEAGFNKVVFVIRKDLEKDFREIIGNRIEKVIDVEYAFQELDNLPDGFTLPEGRTKPWGTGQAILACKGLINEPFGVINADDYYGKEAFVKLHDYLVGAKSKKDNGDIFDISMVGFVLGNTLSENGAVTRGVCQVENGKVAKVIETGGIVKNADGSISHEDNGSDMVITTEDYASMNMWGFTPDFLDELESGFADFLSKVKPEDLKAEYLLPRIVDGLLTDKRATLEMLTSNDKWFGVTYKEDKPFVVASFKKLIEDGVYPENLWG